MPRRLKKPDTHNKQGYGGIPPGLPRRIGLAARITALETQLKEAREALRRSEDRYSLVMTGPNEGIWEWDPKTKALRLSARLLSILGFQKDTLHTTSDAWLDLVHPDDRRAYQNELIQHLKGQTPHFEAQYRVLAQSGEYRWCLARGVAQRDEHGVAWRMVGSIGDITPLRTSMDSLEAAHRELEERVAARTLALSQEISERRRAEEALRAAKEQAEVASHSKSEFLANMSHELRTPLNAILGFSEMIAAEMLGTIENRRYIDYASIIHESGDHLLRVINDILDLSKIEAGKMDFHPEPIDVGEVTETCRRLLHGRADEAGLRLSIGLSQRLPPLHADPLRLKQVLLNLMSNAIKFTPVGGTIALSAHPGPAGCVTLTVSDTGIGMDDDGLRKALEPFGQVDSRLARRYQGTGLGLPLSRQLIELQGGTLTVHSAPGRGTRVTITLPEADTTGA